MYKTNFIINKIFFNVSFENKLLFEKHQSDQFQNIKTIILFSYGSDRNSTSDDIKLHATENNKNFVNYKDADFEVSFYLGYP